MVETRGDGISVADGVKVPGVYVITSKRRPNQTQRCSSSLVPHGADSSAIVAAVAATRPVVVTPGVSTARTAIRDGTDAAAEWRNAAACASVMESGDGASRERIAENRQFADDRLSIKASNCGDAEHDEAIVAGDQSMSITGAEMVRRREPDGAGGGNEMTSVREERSGPSGGGVPRELARGPRPRRRPTGLSVAVASACTTRDAKRAAMPAVATAFFDRAHVECRDRGGDETHRHAMAERRHASLASTIVGAGHISSMWVDDSCPS